ncbi:hypothetical protein A3F29_01905 [Candidatus Roizmanbacteria bacterium RIFCSPHIGHO2_12_FULL_33_9]|uniref:Uncharacterized protein n=1 Tax=Candidatus Roizmanbacteria bacterium RIFCSPHIGHO2_12_FULL_33_9 TaxID=1802045 RepID=A0A1F7HFI1_9BACT|nr:MAG: hypothetical protein A3F29_01905 [Candidatus Roizmanbacteria bacterium RIFCSPHIGHO2_12_FULL_33_9]
MQDYITELVLLLIVIVAMNFVKSVPYINILLIRQEVGFFLVFLFVMFIFSPRVKHTVIFILGVVFSLLMFFSLLQSKFLTEQMGNVLYAFLLIGFIQFLFSLRKK